PMKDRTSCPSSQQLAQLLAEDLTGGACAAMEAHVEGCLTCQQILEALTAAALSPSAPVRSQPASDQHDLTVDKEPRRRAEQEFLSRLMARGPTAEGNRWPLTEAVGAEQEAGNTTWPAVREYEDLGVVAKRR